MYKRQGVDEAFNIDWGSTGWIITFFMVLIGFTLFLSSPKISILVGSLIFVALILFNVVLSETKPVVALLIFFIAFTLTKIPVKVGE